MADFAASSARTAILAVFHNEYCIRRPCNMHRTIHKHNYSITNLQFKGIKMRFCYKIECGGGYSDRLFGYNILIVFV
jgi:hypothetical protein